MGTSALSRPDRHRADRDFIVVGYAGNYDSIGARVTMELFDWDREEILFHLAQPEAWDGLDVQRLDRLVLAGLSLVGRGDADADRLAADFYPAFARRGTTDHRRRIFSRVVHAAREGLLRGTVHACFLRGETDREIVSEAAFEIACLDAAGPEGVRGADYVLDLVVNGAVLNPGAALGGLLARADRRVLIKLARLRRALELPGTCGAVAQMAHCARPCVHTGAVGFWVEWMQKLAAVLPVSQQVLDCAADALAGLRESMVEPVVYDGCCSLPIQRLGLRHVNGEMALREYAAAIAPRLAAIAVAAPGSASVQRAVAAWGMQH